MQPQESEFDKIWYRPLC